MKRKRIFVDEKLMLLSDVARLEQRTCVTAVYYVPDERKAGGRYEEQDGSREKNRRIREKTDF